MYKIEVPPEIAILVAQHAPVIFNTSGGKDSDAAAIATSKELDAMGHRGPRILIHSDLGRIEWEDSLAQCRRLSEFLGTELVVVRRKAGGAIERWQQRWASNVHRYAHLETVYLIHPWSSASMRFCTSELKTAPIAQDVVRRWPGQTIISVVGLRRDESSQRAKAPVVRMQPRFTRKRTGTSGYEWHPILNWTYDDVVKYHHLVGFPLHEAYTKYGSGRVSCTFCVLASHHDLLAATTCSKNNPVYQELVELEATSTFGFQEHRWLADVAPHLLPDRLRDDIDRAKRCAQIRKEAEARIPHHLLLHRGIPQTIPSVADAEILAEVRTIVAKTLNIEIKYTEPDSIREHYHRLLRNKHSTD